MKKTIIILTMILFATQVWASEVSNLPAGAALQKLKQGNERFVQMDLKHPNITKERRNQITDEQHPFVIVLSCSDSRVPPEMIFDQGLGDIFVIRNAGNVLDEHVIGSIEYAVEHLGVNLIVVLGHESCGAVGATMKNTKGSKYIESIKNSIKPAIIQAKKENNLSSECVSKNNAYLASKEVLKRSEIIQKVVKTHGLKVVPAYYHLTSGEVEFLSK